MRLGNVNTATILNQTGQAPGTINGDKEEVGEFSDLVAFLNVSAFTVGTGGTLDVRLQDSADGENWVDIPGGAFAQSTAAITRRLAVENIGRFVRAVSAVGGTGSSSTHSVKVVGIR